MKFTNVTTKQDILDILNGMWFIKLNDILNIYFTLLVQLKNVFTEPATFKINFAILVTVTTFYQIALVVVFS